jgi:hypothetical protein
MKNTQNIFAESKIFMTYQSKISKSELKRLWTRRLTKLENNKPNSLSNSYMFKLNA